MDAHELREYLDDAPGANPAGDIDREALPRELVDDCPTSSCTQFAARSSTSSASCTARNSGRDRQAPSLQLTLSTLSRLVRDAGRSPPPESARLRSSLTGPPSFLRLTFVRLQGVHNARDVAFRATATPRCRCSTTSRCSRTRRRRHSTLGQINPARFEGGRGLSSGRGARRHQRSTSRLA
jgi:hypothetical protein